MNLFTDTECYKINKHIKVEWKRLIIGMINMKY